MRFLLISVFALLASLAGASENVKEKEPLVTELLCGKELLERMPDVTDICIGSSHEPYRYWLILKKDGKVVHKVAYKVEEWMRPTEAEPKQSRNLVGKHAGPTIFEYYVEDARSRETGECYLVEIYGNFKNKPFNVVFKHD